MQAETHTPTRTEAFALVREYITSENLVAHVLAVEGVMRYMARKLGEDEEKWGVIGLAHDIDYEKYPELHCRKSPEILRQAGWPEDYIRAIVSHGWGICSEVEPVERMEKVLYAIDELTGLIVATALMRPSRSVMDMEARSVLKKWKNERFAAGVKRPVIEKGAAMLGVGLEELIADTIMGMRDVAKEIGLAGVPSGQ
ncbi:MAG: HDIG domain-containing metalloprotein [Spirochaetia bacterium]|jgi:putative nucleotidyltransferase with HDIG domain